MRQGLTRTVFTLSLAMVILLGVSTHASAATYRIWYYDDDFNTYNPGDVSVGWVKFVPPAWAVAWFVTEPALRSAWVTV